METARQPAQPPADGQPRGTDGAGGTGDETPGSGSRHNLADLVRAAAARRPEKAALVSGSRTVSWSALDADIDAFAAALGELGVGERSTSRVLVACGNTPEFVVAYFGCLRGGAVAVPVNTSFTAAEMREVLDDARPVAAVAQGAAVQTLRDAASGRADLRVVVAGEHDAAGNETAYQHLLETGRAARTTHTPGHGDELAVLVYTAGTTGRPRGAMLTHRALLANLDQCLALDPPPVTEDDVVLVALPLFHIYALNAALGMVVRTGATAVLADGFDPVETLATLRDAGVTCIPGAPPMYLGWAGTPGLDDALRGVRMLTSGAAPLPVDALSALREATGLTVHEGYGLTESAPVLTTTLASDRVKPGSVGRPVAGVELRLVDTDGADVDAGDPGEVCVRGANLFVGYWPDSADGPDGDGWYRTGDIGYTDEDGDLFLVGRRKELVLVSGFNVYPAEVEDALRAHPDVLEAAVVPVPDERTGEAVKAYVVPRPGAAVTEDGLRTAYSVRLARFKWPTVVEVVPALPHSLAGKVAKRWLVADDGRPA